MPNFKFKVTFEVWNEDGTKTVCTEHMEDDVSIEDLRGVEKLAETFITERRVVGGGE